MEMKESLSSAASSPQSEDVPMDDAVQSSGNSGDEGAGSASNQSDSPRGGGADTHSGDEGTPRPSGATSNLAKFKASQDLRIQTANLPPASSGKAKQRAHSVGSSADMGGGEDPEEGSAEDGKTPIPVPCSTGKKRRRRTAAQIDRKYPCTYPGCTKAYGSEGSLTQHQRLKHRNQSPEPGVQAAQLNNFFLPLHRTPRSLPSALGRVSGPGGARTVTIRPAGIEGLTLHGFDVASAAAAASLVPENDTMAGDFLLPSPNAHTLGHSRQHLRARSNSMPISFSTTSALAMQYTSAGPPPPPSTASAAPLVPLSVGETTTSSAKAKPTRRGRVSGTPRSGGKPPLRRNKSRSKSESLQDVMEPFVLHDEIRPPIMDRSASDNAVGTGSFALGPASAPAFARSPYDWRFAIAHSQHSDSPVSSVEEAIDSDILSVLADYDTSDTGDSTLELVGSGSFEDATESSRASSSGGRFPEPEDEWMTHGDTQYLTTHLEKMSMIHDSPPGSIPGQSMVAEDDPMTTVKLEFPDPLDVMGPPHRIDPASIKPFFPGGEIDSFAVDPVEPPFVAGEDMKDGLKLHVSGLNDPSAVLLGRDLFETASSSGFKQEPASAPAPAPQPSWTKELAALDTYTTSGIDQADYMDVDASSYGPLQWKAAEKLRPTTSQALFGGSFDSLTAYLQHGEKHGAYASLSDTFALDSVDYAMEEPRLSSPVVCQQKDL